MLTCETIYGVERFGVKNSFPLDVLNMKYIFDSDNGASTPYDIVGKTSLRILLATEITDLLIVKIIHRNHISLICEIVWNPQKKG